MLAMDTGSWAPPSPHPRRSSYRGAATCPAQASLRPVLSSRALMGTHAQLCRPEWLVGQLTGIPQWVALALGTCLRSGDKQQTK